jgi:hypothetical protein
MISVKLWIAVSSMFHFMKGKSMSQLFRMCVLGAALAAAGCGGSTPELGPAKDTPKVDQAEIDKKMQDAMQRNNMGDNVPVKVDIPTGDNKPK